MNRSSEIKDLLAALCKFQGVLKPAIKDVENTFFKASYANLEGVWSVIRAPLSSNDLVVTQTTEIRDTTLGLVTTLFHVSGQFIEGFYPISPVKADPQAFGSAMTYARRYTLAAILGVVQADDDGEGAMDRGNTTSPSPIIPKNHAVNMDGPPPQENPFEDGPNEPFLTDEMKPIVCQCGSDLKLTKAGDKYYCPMFKTGGEHIFPILKAEYEGK